MVGLTDMLNIRSLARKVLTAVRSRLKKAGVTLPLSRNERVLFGCSLQGVGLEIGASYSPVAPKKSGYCVEILDHADAPSLRAKYQGHNVDIGNIEEVDYVWSGEPLDVLTKKKDYYDWIVASHVIEHTPDLVSFLRQCETMLKPDGVLCLAVPDHRYCFDIFRPASTPGDVIQAYVEKRCRHSAGTVWDHFSLIVKKAGRVSWSKGFQGEYRFIHEDTDDACNQLSRAQSEGEYIDVHNWRFTPSSFRLITNDIAALGYTSLSVVDFFETEGCEFITHLKKCQERPGFDNKRRMNLAKEMLNEARDFSG